MSAVDPDIRAVPPATLSAAMAALGDPRRDHRRFPIAVGKVAEYEY